jgi:hypothetical protein
MLWVLGWLTFKTRDAVSFDSQAIIEIRECMLMHVWLAKDLKHLRFFLGEGNESLPRYVHFTDRFLCDNVNKN